ncbi:hypothetical protein [Comamonas sp. JC664]|uniref:hypothetical protein n=1 Tax=Comamonas sp. JC664 TaxID=2801917 RepID=UPI00366D3D70
MDAVLSQEMASQLQGQSLVFLSGDTAGQTQQIPAVGDRFEAQSRAAPGMAAYGSIFRARRPRFCPARLTATPCGMG